MSSVLFCSWLKNEVTWAQYKLLYDSSYWPNISGGTKYQQSMKEGDFKLKAIPDFLWGYFLLRRYIYNSWQFPDWDRYIQTLLSLVVGGLWVPWAVHYLQFIYIYWSKIFSICHRKLYLVLYRKGLKNYFSIHII